MKVVLFCHSYLSDWNHGNAHFLRGVTRELHAGGHRVTVCEPRQGWSRSNLVAEHGAAPLAEAAARFPFVDLCEYEPDGPNLEQVLDGADLVLVHEWTEPGLVARIGQHRAHGGRYRLLFHDTHHRAVSDRDGIGRFALDGYDGVLAFGAAVREIYLREGWAARVWIWHEAADVALFRPLRGRAREGDLVWIGNWGDGERTAELDEFLLQPARALGLAAHVFGVRYPPEALARLETAGVDYRGWLANYRVPETFAGYRVTVHVPRRPYVAALPGIPTIRVFEALACGIPLISAPWCDAEGLFRPGRDFLVARSGAHMERLLRSVLRDPALAAELAVSGLESVRGRHTCAHRVAELLAIHASLTRPVEEAA